MKINAKIGETFKIGKYEFIRFKNVQSGVAVLSKDILFNSRFGDDNNLSKSDILEKLMPILKEIEDAIGAENVLEFETDLTSLDGSKKHGVMRSKISLPTFDFYRENVSIFDGYTTDSWWWLATPDTTSDHYNDDWIVCVAPRGRIGVDIYYGDYYGVRPFCIFSPSIFESCEE